MIFYFIGSGRGGGKDHSARAAAEQPSKKWAAGTAIHSGTTSAKKESERRTSHAPPKKRPAKFLALVGRLKSKKRVSTYRHI